MSDVNVSVTEEGTVAVMVGGEAGIAAHDADPDAHAGKDTSVPAGVTDPSTYYPPTVFGSLTTRAANDATLFAIPLLVEQDMTLDRIAIEVTTAGAASTVIRLGLYNDDTGLPGSLAFEAGTVAGDTTGGKEITISQAVTAGWYWLACVSEGGSPTVRAIGGHQPQRVGAPAAASSTEAAVYFASGVTAGSLPDPFPASPSIANLSPAMRIRRAA